MTLAPFEHAQKRIQQKWYELVMAEQRGETLAVLERMHNSYLLALEEYNCCSAATGQECQSGSSPAPVKPKNGRKASSSHRGEQTKLAS